MIKGRHALGLIGASAAAGFLVAGGLVTLKPSGYFSQEPDFSSPLDSPKEQNIPQETLAEILASLPEAPVMSLETAQAIIAAHTGPGPAPIIEDSPDQDGIKLLKWLDAQGRPHREGAPAVLAFDPLRNRRVMEIWVEHGHMHRADGKPASTEWSAENGKVIAQTWRRNGTLDNNTGPATREFYWEKNYLSQQWMRAGVKFRKNDLPTQVNTDLSTGIDFFERWASKPEGGPMKYRSDGLELLERNPVTGTITRKRYHFQDLHTPSDEITYELWNHPESGVLQREEWRKNETIIGLVNYDLSGKPWASWPSAQDVEFLRRGSEALQKLGGPSP